MQVTKIVLQARKTFNLPIVGASPTDPYLLLGADGLSPAEMNVSMGKTVLPYSYFQGRSTASREAVFLIGLNPNYVTNSPSSMRDDLYSLIGGEDGTVVVRFYNGTTQVANSTGYVKLIETAPFGKELQVQITIVFSNPYFKSPTSVSYTPTDPAHLGIDYQGTAPTGFVFKVRLNNPATYFQLMTPENLWLYIAKPKNAAFASGDILEVSTVYRARYVKITHAGATTTWPDALSPNSRWLQLYMGTNTFRVTNPSAGQSTSPAVTWMAFTYYPQYLGI